jgi:hypothetical protein
MPSHINHGIGYPQWWYSYPEERAKMFYSEVHRIFLSIASKERRVEVQQVVRQLLTRLKNDLIDATPERLKVSSSSSSSSS